MLTMQVALVVGYLLMPIALLAEAPAASTARDSRLPIALAPPRRENWKCLMRGHLHALTESMRHLSNGEFELAAATTESNFGLATGTVEYCRERLFSKEESEQAAKLPPSPPPEVVAMFDEMHAAARVFVTNARAASRTNDPAAAWKSLAALGDTCIGCHLVYRID
jgi:cytochrome c556